MQFEQENHFDYLAMLSKYEKSEIPPSNTSGFASAKYLMCIKSQIRINFGTAKSSSSYLKDKHSTPNQTYFEP